MTGDGAGRPPPPEDRLGDLGASRERGGPGDSAGARLADLDREEERRAKESQAEEPPPSGRPGSRYSWVVGVAFLILIVVVLLNGLRTEGPGASGLDRGTRLPPFAAPLATGRHDGDANVCARRPCPEGSGSRPACEVRGPGIFNVCELRRRPLVLTYVFLRRADCEPHLDVLERVRRGFPRVQFAAVVGGESLERVGRLVREHRLGYPVATDRDLEVSNLYGVGGCPTTMLAYPGGTVRETRLGRLDDRALRAAVARLSRAAARRR